MNIFSQIMSAVMGSAPQAGHTALERLMARAGMPTDFGSALRDNPRLPTSGIPASVLGGCKQELVVIPGTDRPAFTKEGKPVLAHVKGSGRKYQVMEQMGIPRKQWKALVNEQKRKAAGRWYSGAQVA